jgi:glycosyltransferase involved in cell wall biosynthesis
VTDTPLVLGDDPLRIETRRETVRCTAFTPTPGTSDPNSGRPLSDRRILVVTAGARNGLPRTSDARDLLHRLDTQKALVRPVLVGYPRTRRGVREFRLVRELRHQVVDFSPDLVLICVPPTLASVITVAVGHLSGVPCVSLVDGLSSVTVASGGGVSRQRFGAARLLERLEQVVFRGSVHVVVPSEQFVPAVRRLAPTTAVTVLPRSGNTTATGTDVDQSADRDGVERETDRQRIRRELGWDGRFVIAHTENLGAHEGLEDLAPALHHLAVTQPDVLVSFLGTGHRRRALTESTAGLHSVQLHDPLPPEQQLDVLRAADVLLVHERNARRELGLPSGLTSLFRAGRPILAVVHDGSVTAAELERSGAGVKVPPHDSVGFAARITQLRANEPGRAAMGAAALRYAGCIQKPVGPDDPLPRLLDRIIHRDDVGERLRSEEVR